MSGVIIDEPSASMSAIFCMGEINGWGVGVALFFAPWWSMPLRLNAEALRRSSVNRWEVALCLR